MVRDCFDDFDDQGGWVELDRLVIDPSFQVRRQTDHQKVREYARAMENAVRFPPLTVADVDGVLFLVDGFHRYEAYRLQGKERVEANVRQMTQEEALRESAVCNLNHGLQLTKTEKRRAFRQFIKGRGHLRGRRFKSYREIAQELQGIGGHTTIRNWMLSDFPKIAQKMGGDLLAYNTEDKPLVNLGRDRGEIVKQSLIETRNLLELINNPEQLYIIKEILKEMMVMVEGKECCKPLVNDDF